MSSGFPHAGLPQILLLEPDGLVRGTVAAVCRDLGLARILAVSNLHQAQQALGECSVQAGLFSLAEREPTLALIERLRGGMLRCPASLPVAVTSGSADEALAQILKSLKVRRVLIKPFKIRDAIGTIEALQRPVMPWH